MPRRRINIAKLHLLKRQLNDLATARDIHFHHRCTRFDRDDRDRWERAVGRAWRSYYNGEPPLMRGYKGARIIWDAPL